MKKNYLSPSLKVVIIESDTMLLAGSGSDEDEKDPIIDKVTIDGNGTLITDGGETETEEEYNPW